MSEITEDKILDALFVKYVTYPRTEYMEFGKGFIVFKDEESGRVFKIQISEVIKKIKK